MQILYNHDVPELADLESQRLCSVADRVASAHPEVGTVHLVLTDDEHLADLNESYRGVIGPTDVLSFSYRAGAGDSPVESDERISGEIYVSVDRARQQACDLGVEYFDELARLVVHGLLHLAGHDHDTPEKLHWMESETDRMLETATALAGGVARKE